MAEMELNGGGVGPLEPREDGEPNQKESSASESVGRLPPTNKRSRTRIGPRTELRRNVPAEFLCLSCLLTRNRPPIRVKALVNGLFLVEVAGFEPTEEQMRCWRQGHFLALSRRNALSIPHR